MVTSWSRGLVLLMAVMVVGSGLLLWAADAPAAKPVMGTVKSVDTEKSSIVVDVKKEEKTFEVAADAKITVAGKKGTLADVKPEMKVKLTLKDDKVTILDASAAAKKKN